MWDSQGRLRSAVDTFGSLSAQYAADGERVRRNAWVQSFGLYDEAGGTVHTPGLAQRKDGIDRLFLGDHLGSTRYLTDAAGGTTTLGQRFDAFGNRSALAGSDPPDVTRHGYAGAWGYETEEGLGLQYLYQRYYDPAVGRFLSRDPIGWAGGLNLYGYCENDPVGLVDPSGLGPEDDEAFIGLLERRWARGARGPFSSRAMAAVNAEHRQLGQRAFGFGNRPVGNDLLMIHAIFGAVGGGGPALRGGSAGVAAAGGGGPGLWTRFKNWLRRVLGPRTPRTTAIVVQHLPGWVTRAADARGYILVGRALQPGETFGPGRLTPSGWQAVHVWLNPRDIAELAAIRGGGVGYAKISVTDLNRLVGEGKIGLGHNMQELRLFNQHLGEICRVLR